MEVFKGLEEGLEVVGGKAGGAGQGSCAIRVVCYLSTSN